MSVVTPVSVRWKEVHGSQIGNAGPTWNQSNPTTKLNDNSTGDTSTYEDWTENSVYAGSCSAQGVTSRIAVLVDFGAVLDFTRFDFQWTYSTLSTNTLIVCPGLPVSGNVTGMEAMERNSTNNPDSTLWILMNPNISVLTVPTATSPSFLTASSYITSGMAPFSARYLRFLFYYSSVGANVVNGDFNALLRLSDVRVSGVSNVQQIIVSGIDETELGIGQLSEPTCWNEVCFPEATGWHC